LPRAVLAAALALSIAGPALARDAGPAADVAAIRALIDMYARSIDAADPALGAEVWDTTPEVSFIHPLGHEHGWEAIKANVYVGLMGGMFSKRKLTVKDVAVHVYGGAAWAEFYWDFAATLRKEGTAVDTHGRETQVYRRTAGRWSLVHVHYSPRPSSVERRF
jgi:uncharacterized protein (TIGR02246 family)